MILPQLVPFLAEAGLGRAEGEIVVGQMPLDARCALLPLETPADPELPGVRCQDFRVVVRAAAQGEAWRLAELAYQALQLSQRALPGAHLWVCRPLRQPFLFGRDENTAWLVAVVFEAKWRAA